MSRSHGWTRRKLIRVMPMGMYIALILSANAFAAGAIPDARSIMEEVYRQDTSHSVAMRANFQVYDKQEKRAQKDFLYRRLGSPGASKTLVVFTTPAEIHGVALL